MPEVKRRYYSKEQYEREWPDVRCPRGYYENGQLAYETPYVNNKVQGLHRCWHSNGQLEYETPYVSNMAHGLSRHYYDDGQLKSEHIYVNGVERNDLLNNKLAQVVVFGEVLC